MTRSEAMTALRELLIENEVAAGDAEILVHEYADDIARNFVDAAALRADFSAIEKNVERIALGVMQIENAGGKIH